MSLNPYEFINIIDCLICTLEQSTYNTQTNPTMDMLIFGISLGIIAGILLCTAIVWCFISRPARN